MVREDILRYGLAVKTAPQTEPVTSDEAIAQLRESAVTAQTYLIDSLIFAAREWVELYLGRALVSTGFTFTLDRFGPLSDLSFYSAASEINLPRNPVSAVSEIRYLDTSGTQTVLAGQAYRLEKTGVVARLTPAYGFSWPATQPVSGAVEIDFTAGYGEAEDVPRPIRQAILMLVSHWYETRTPVINGGGVAQVPMTVEFLLGPYRIRG